MDFLLEARAEIITKLSLDFCSTWRKKKYKLGILNVIGFTKLLRYSLFYVPIQEGKKRIFNFLSIIEAFSTGGRLEIFAVHVVICFFAAAGFPSTSAKNGGVLKPPVPQIPPALSLIQAKVVAEVDDTITAAHHRLQVSSTGSSTLEKKISIWKDIKQD